MLTFSTSTPMFEPKRSESYTKCWLFPQCNRLRHTNIHGNCKCLYVRSTHQSATHAVIKTHRQLSSILRFPPALAGSFWAILRPTKGSSTYGSSESWAFCFRKTALYRRNFGEDLKVCLSFVYDPTSEVPEATSHDITYEPVSWTGASHKCRLQTIVKKTCFIQIAKFFRRNSCRNVYFQIIK